MNKKEYFSLVTLVFGLITLLNLMNLASPGLLLIPYWGLIKIFFTIFICLMEIKYIKNELPKAIGFSFCAVFLMGTLFKIMHWPGADIMILAGSVVIFLNLVVMALIENNKGLLQYLLFAYIGIRMLLILRIFPVLSASDILWWSDVVVCCLIAVAGVLTLKGDIK
jgi:hypothetical protein